MTTNISPAFRRVIAAGVAVAMASLGAITGTPTTASAAPSLLPDDALILHYEFETAQVNGPTVDDLSTRNLDASITNVASSSLVDGHLPGTRAIDLPGGASDSTTAAYLTVPTGLFADTSAATISSWVKWDGGPDFQWLYNLGKDQNNTIFFTPSFSGDAKSRSSIKPVNGGAEVGVSGAGKLATGTWVNIATVVDQTSIKYYIDGALAGTTPAALDLDAVMYSSGAANSGFLGKPFWNGHPFFDGAIDDFRVYNVALTDAQVAELAANPAAQIDEVLQTSAEVTTSVGVAPVLPGTVPARYSDGVTRGASVTWDDIDPAAYESRRTFTVMGTVDNDGTEITATVTVTAPNEFAVDFATNTGEFHGGASGSLYGVYGEGLPSSNLLEGMQLRTVSTKAQDGPQHPGADALEVVKPLADASDGDVYIYMTDIYRGFPYQWPGNTPQAKLDDFKARISKQVDQVLELPLQYQDNIVFVPFNEPEGNMFGNGEWSYNGTSWLDNPTAYFQAWDEVNALIKAKMPDARIAGPNTSILYSQVQGFMEHTVENDTVPEVMTWHELGDPATLRSQIAVYRTWEDDIFDGTAYEGKHLPININEYAHNYHTSVPGQMIQWISAIEESKVDADIAYWSIDGNLNDSAVEANKGNGQWWLLNAYGNMSGHTVAVTPPQPNVSYTLQGVATLDEANKQARVIMGGASGSSSVYLDNVPHEVFGSTAHVLVQEIPWTGQIGDSAQPRVLSEFDATITEGSVALTFGSGLPALKEESAYQVILTPGANATATQQASELWRGTYEAEAATHTGSGYSVNGPEGGPSNLWGYYTSGRYNVGGLRTGSDVVLNFPVSVPQDGSYDLSIFANSLNTFDKVAEQGPTNVFITVDGGAEQEIFLPLGYKWVVWDHADTTVDLAAGDHTISLSARSLDGTRVTKGDAIVDKIDLVMKNPAAAESIYEGEYAVLKGAVADYSAAGVSGSGSAIVESGDSATFWVYSPIDGESTISVDAAGTGSAQLSVNGISVDELTGSAQLPVFLSAGVNKVQVTGASGALSVDRLRVASTTGNLSSTVYEAEDATVAGTAAVSELTLASGGKAVTGIGGDQGNSNTLTFDEVSAPVAGTYALTIRYSNEEQSPATHYNPDPLARHADVTINGDMQRVLFPHSFHKNLFWEIAVPVELEAGTNTISFSSQELPSFDGTTLISEVEPELLRSDLAPNIDKISVTSFTDFIVDPKVAATVTSSAAPIGGWYANPVSIELALNEGAVGDIEYRLDSSEAWAPYTAPITVAADGAHVFEYRAVLLGEPVAESGGTENFSIDRLAPSLAVDVTPDAAVGSPTSPVTVSAAAVDTGSGLASIEYRIDQGEWMLVSGLLTFDTIGSFDVDFRATDVAGNVSGVQTTRVVVSDTPVVGILLEPAAPVASGWHSGPVSVTLALNPGADADIQFRLDGGDWTTYESAFTVGASGSHTVDYRAVQGQTSVEGSGGAESFKIDVLTPASTVTLSPESGTGSSVTATFAATDEHSGVNGIEYRVSGGGWQSVTGPVTFSTIGSYVIDYRSADKVGNVESIKTVSVAVLAPVDPASPTKIALSASMVAQGGTVTVTGSGFEPQERVDLTLHSAPRFLGSVQANANGEFSFVATIPADAPTGAHLIQAVGANSGKKGEAPLTVVAPGTLALTGFAPQPMVIIAFLMVLCGGLAVAALSIMRSRRRARTE